MSVARNNFDRDQENCVHDHIYCNACGKDCGRAKAADDWGFFHFCSTECQVEYNSRGDKVIKQRM